MKKRLIEICAAIVLAMFVSFSSTALADESSGDSDPTDALGVPSDISDNYSPDDEFADDPVDEDIDEPGVIEDEPSYKNPAQAHHAANLQEQALANDPDLTAEAEKVADAEQKEQDAWDALENSELDPDSDEYAKLEQDYEDAKEATLEAQDAYADMLGERTGVLADEIADMRQVQKMGWGEIAHYLGVEPKYLGRRLGHTKNWKNQYQVGVETPTETDGLAPEEPTTIEQELAEATQRNTKTGWSNGHGLKSNSSNSTKDGLGLSKSSGKAAGDAKGNKGGSSSAKSGSSNNGKSSKGGSSAQSASSNSGKSSNKGKSSTSSSNSSKSSSDKDKSNNGKSGSNNGKSGSNNGNSGNNGNKGGNSKNK